MLNKFSVLLLQIFLGFANAWFETCDYQYSIPTTSTTYLVSQNYPDNYPSGSSCKWYLLAPVGYTISLSCYIDITKVGGDCQSQRFYISRDGDKNLAYANYYCGYTSTPLQLSSVGNEITLGYTSNSGGNGWIYCEAKPVPTTQSNCQCGWNKASRIVGGSVASPNEYVSMAGVIDRQENLVFCGSALISENYALSAAHCFNTPRNIANINLLVGDQDITRTDDTPYATNYTVKRILRHPNYIPASDNQNFDIALIQTGNPISWKKTIGPACLPFIFTGFSGSETYFNGYSLVVLGWGSTSFAGATSTVLKKTSLAVIDSVSCNSTYYDINSDKICTFTKGTDSCQYDSGGNLYWTYNNKQYTIGIVSYGTGCASNSPSVNTRVTSYLDWITQQLPGEFFCRQ